MGSLAQWPRQRTGISALEPGRKKVSSALAVWILASEQPSVGVRWSAVSAEKLKLERCQSQTPSHRTRC